MIRYYCRFAAVAAFAAASATVLLTGCASDPKAEQTAQADKRNPCLGVEPSTGSMVRRKEDCGASRSQDDQSKQEIIDAIRQRGGYNPSSVKP